MVPTTPYDQFDATKGDSFWGCETTCVLFTHQSNATLGVNNMLLVPNNIAGNAQATQFANKQVNFTWGFSTCATTQMPSMALIRSNITASNIYEYADVTLSCPQMNTVTHAGTTTLGSDGVLSIVFGAYWDAGGVPFNGYIGNFVLQLSPSDTTPSTSSSNTTVIPQSPVGTSPGTNGCMNGPPAPTWNNGVIIGGAIGGVVAAILIMILIWVFRRRKTTTEVKEMQVRRILPFPFPHEEYLLE